MTGTILALGAVVSALAFGGVEPLAFAPVEIAVMILACSEFWRHGWMRLPRATLWIGGVLLAIPFLQLLPLPVAVLQSLSPHRVELARNILATVAPAEGMLPFSVYSYQTRLAALRWICYALVFLLGYRLCRSGQRPTRLLEALISIGLFEAVYGMVQYLAGWQYIFTYAKQYDTAEATGTYINRNHFAGLLEMVLPFLLARALFRSPAEPASRRSQWKQIIVAPASSRFLQDMLLFAIVALALVFSRSRMGIAAALLGTLLVVGISFFRTRRRSALILGLLLAALPAAYAVWIGVAPVVRRFEVIGSSDVSEQSRLPIWQDTVEIIRDYPLLGTGLGTYPWSSLHYQTHALYVRYEHAHNDYLEFAADLGLPAALLLFGSLWVLAAKTARKSTLFRRPREQILAAGCAGAMVALLTHALVDFNLQIPANAYIFSWIAGTAAALVARPSRLGATLPATPDASDSEPVEGGAV